MSKGLGKIQIEMQRIIEASDKPLSTFELAAMLYRPAGDLTPAQIKATGRAVRGLVKRGKVQKEGHGSDGRARWAKAGYENLALKVILEQIERDKAEAAARFSLFMSVVGSRKP
jgi:hypothetical protein